MLVRTQPGLTSLHTDCALNTAAVIYMTYKHTNTCTHREQSFGNDRRCERTALVTCTHMLRPDTNNSKSRRASSLIICIANIPSPAVFFTQILFGGCSSLQGALQGLHWHALACSSWCVCVCVCETEGERQSRRRGGKQAILWLSHMGIHERQADRRTETREGQLLIQLQTQSQAVKMLSHS